MPLILAVNPGGSQSSTLARLARELKSCELIAADSYAIAIKAIDQRVPNLVLLPGVDGKGVLDLMSRLRAVPGGVPTLKLPPPGAIDFGALAAEVSALLPRPVPEPARPPAHLVAAARVMIDWIRARRAAWADTDVLDREPESEPEPEPEPPVRVPYRTPVSIPAMPQPSPAWTPPMPESNEPSVLTRAADAARDSRDLAVAWLPRLAALGLLVGVSAAGMYYWPDIRERWSTTIDTIGIPSQVVEPEESTPAPSGPPSARSGRAGAQPPASNEPRLPGWIAVFSPVELTISEGNAAVQLDDQGRAMLPAGSHVLRFRNRALGYDEVRTVQVKPTATTTLNVIPQTTLGVTSNEPAEVLIDGTAIGQTPIVKRRLNLGTHTVIVRTSAGEREITVEATTKPIQIDVDFTKP